MVRKQWLKLPLVARMLLVVVGILAVFAWLVRLLPSSVDLFLVLGALGCGLAYAGWEWHLIRRKKVALEAEYHRRPQDWRQGLPAHLLTENRENLPSSMEEKTLPDMDSSDNEKGDSI